MQERNENALSLTQSQLQLWAGQKLNPNAPLHNTTHSFKIFGKIDETVFQNAFQNLIDKVDVLRINFGEEDGIPYQYILEEFGHTMDIVDCSKWAEVDIKEWLHNKSQNKLDLSAKVFDTALLRVNEEKYIWFLNMHHLITDAVSATLMFRNLSAIYSSLQNNTTSERIDFPKFQSYVDFEREERLNPDSADIKKYWKDKVESIKGTPLLYGARSYEKTTESTRISVKLGAERSGKLRKLAENPEIKGWTQKL